MADTVQNNHIETLEFWIGETTSVFARLNKELAKINHSLKKIVGERVEAMAYPS